MVRKYMKATKLLALILISTPIIATAQTKLKPLVFTHVNVIDATGARAQSDMAVVVAGGRIADIGKFSGVKIPSCTQWKVFIEGIEGENAGRG
jgi:hypothetical protein